jgi:hypothetical protein
VEGNGETWRPLQIRFPASVATHSANQTLWLTIAGDIIVAKQSRNPIGIRTIADRRMKVSVRE